MSSWSPAARDASAERSCFTLLRKAGDVAVHYLHSAADATCTRDEVLSHGVRAAMLQADLADEAACRALLPRAIDALGQVDAVVNNASLFDYDDAATITHASMDRHWRSNTFPAIALAQALYEHLAEREATGCVVNLLDQKLWNPNPDHLSYTLSKSALETATGLLARTLAPRVRVVGVAPGVTLASGPMSNADFDEAATMTPLGRSSTPNDVARAVSYLLDARAVTGTTLLVDGGQHLSAQPRDVMFLTNPADRAVR